MSMRNATLFSGGAALTRMDADEQVRRQVHLSEYLDKRIQFS